MVEKNNIELICRRVERTEQLIAKFVNGYASGWDFAVKEVFKDSLDIKKTDKTINKKLLKFGHKEFYITLMLEMYFIIIYQVMKIGKSF